MAETMTVTKIDRAKCKELHNELEVLLKGFAEKHGLVLEPTNARYNDNLFRITKIDFLTESKVEKALEDKPADKNELAWGLSPAGTIAYIFDNGTFCKVKIIKSRRTKYAFEFLEGSRRAKEYVANFSAFKAERP
jgi:hypothetical protein